jgi:putative aminopeptidase FrvX
MLKIEKLLTLTERETFNYVKKVLKKLRVDFTSNKDYIITQQHADPTPLICVHLDTVSILPPKAEDIVVLEDAIKLAPTSLSKCLGADDRAGVWIALEMLRLGTKTKFEYGFFCGEETGGVGSRSYSFLDLEHTCFIGLDRGSKLGIQNVAEYGLDNEDLTKIFTDLGYEASNGTFSDCSALAMESDVACVNVSVGYVREHTDKETLYLDLMLNTLDVMREVVIPEQVFKSAEVYNWRTDYRFAPKSSNAILCDLCGRHEKLYMANSGMYCEECVGLYTRENSYYEGAI